MGLEEHPQRPMGEVQFAAELAALSQRVESLEREVDGLRLQRSGAVDKAVGAPPIIAPPPFPVPRLVMGEAPPTPMSVQQVSLENRLGSQVFSRVGIVALLIGATWFLKWAIDNHWIGPLGRILAGLVAGAGLVVWSERFRRNGYSTFSYSLKAVGSGVLYLSLWAAFQLYHLLPAEAALGAMILVTAWNGYMAWAQDAEVLAAYALAGGLATPLLLSTGGNHESFLFTYILAINLATIVLVRLKPWPRLLLGALPATVVYFIGWYGQFERSDGFLLTSIFVALFAAAFASVPIRRSVAHGDDSAPPRRTSAGRITDILLPLGNAAFGSLAFYSLLQDSGRHADLPWLMVIFAAIYLGLMRLPQSAVASAVHLSLAVVFLTIAVPLKASGHWLTVSWLVEGMALLWVSWRLGASSSAVEDDSLAAAHRTLRWLSVSALLLGFIALLTQPQWFDSYYSNAFMNARFATALVGIAAFGVVAWISLQAIRGQQDAPPFWRQMAGASIIAINAVAVLACVREIEAFWSHGAAKPEADLQQALAISAFLMLYGAGLLAVGFWKRRAFVRWQALLLLVFTIAKTFLYDMRNLSQGYRVVSFLGLGALLMGVSFAYQKDWLALREAQADAALEPPQETGVPR
jgi:uncharacterized membrane protein